MDKKDFGLQLVLSPCRFPDKKHIDKYNKIYQCWHDVWSSAFEEIDGNRELRSDAFTRQDYAVAIFNENECMGMILLRYMDTTMIPTANDSYFNVFSEFMKKKIPQLGQYAFTCSFLSVAPQARQNKLGVSLKEVIPGICAKMAVLSSADVLFAMPRIKKGVHDTVYRWGAKPVARELPWRSTDTVDFAAFYRENILKSGHELFPLIDSLWESRLVIEFQEFENVNAFSMINKIIPFRKTG